jgi:hypothetical protein
MDCWQIQEKLKSLKSKKDVQGLFIDLNFDYSGDDDFNWLDKIITSKLKEKIDYVNIINEYKTFNIFYCKLKIKNLYRNRFLQRDIAKKIARESDCIIVFANDDEDIFRVVYADLPGTPVSESVHHEQQQDKSKGALKLSGYTISKDEKLRTASEQLLKIEIKEEISVLDLINNIKKAFEIEPVTNEFFGVIKSYVEKITENYQSYFSDKQKSKAFALQFFNRLLFLKYIEKKKWLNNNSNFLSELVEKFEASSVYDNSNQTGIYDNLLKPLFFFSFSKNKKYYPSGLSQDLTLEIKKLPYLNGGLFEKNELDLDFVKITDFEIKGIFKDILDKYNFTVTEDTPFDREIAIDPEMLGLIYESIVNEEERSGSGIFYTPRIEVDFMCKKSLLHYFYSNTQIDQEKLIDLIFKDSSEYQPQTPAGLLTSDEKEKILSEINELKVLDPACGSGAFLIGMLQNILEIIIKVDELDLEELYQTEPGYLYKRKKEFIEKIIHGVDIKPWAAQLAELRLWLYLIWDYETDIENLLKKPLLPSLDFKIRQGDSLLSEIEGNPIILRNIGGVNRLAPDIYSKVHKIIELKEKYYRHIDVEISKNEIEQAEKELITHILNRKRIALSKKLNSLYGGEKVAEPQRLFEVTEQQKMDLRVSAEKLRKEQEETEDELDRIEDLIRNLGSIKEKDYFIWEIDFAEIFFAKLGFDIIIGNPPYVRQEEIAPPLIEKEKITVEIKRDYKERLINNIISINGKEKIPRFNRKADYYVYFYFVCLSLLKTDGIFTFINSTSWLDVGYGTFLQEFLLKNFKIIDIHDNQVKRSFKSADINTIIISIQRPETYLDLQDNMARFVMHKVSFEESLNSANLKLVYNSNSVISTNVLRIYPKSQAELLDEGFEKEEDSIFKGKYTGSKWGGKFLRAPDIYFTVLEKGKGKLIPLKEIAEVRRGFTTGANDFFYVEPTGKPAQEGLLHVKNGAGWEGFIEEEFLRPVIKSPRECKSIIVNDKDLKYKVFLCNKSKKELKGTNAFNYIEWGEKQKYHKRPTCCNRHEWWNLKVSRYGDLFCMMSFNDRHIFWENKNNLVDARLYDIYLNNRKDYDILKIILNSTITPIFIELGARTNLGEGALDFKVYEAERILILNPELIGKEIIEKINNSFLSRKILSIFKECGFDQEKAIRSQNPNPLPDRKALDDIVFDILNLTVDERKEVYWSVCELVQNRLQKASSI